MNEVLKYAIGVLVAGAGFGVFKGLKSLKKMPFLMVKAHFAKFEGEKVEHCFVKITNTSRDTVTVTHVDFVGDDRVVPLLARLLPKRLEPSDVFETFIPVAALRVIVSDDALVCFRVCDSLGGFHYSIKNHDVPSKGYVAG